MTCPDCGLPCVPFGGELVCDCPDGGNDTAYERDDDDDERCGDPDCESCYPYGDL